MYWSIIFNKKLIFSSHHKIYTTRFFKLYSNKKHVLATVYVIYRWRYFDSFYMSSFFSKKELVDGELPKSIAEYLMNRNCNRLKHVFRRYESPIFDVLPFYLVSFLMKFNNRTIACLYIIFIIFR